MWKRILEWAGHIANLRSAFGLVVAVGAVIAVWVASVWGILERIEKILLGGFAAVFFVQLLIVLALTVMWRKLGMVLGEYHQEGSDEAELELQRWGRE